MPTLTCEWCGESFDVLPYRADSARFCSQSCLGKSNSRHPNVQATQFEPGDVRGSANPKWKDGIEFVCERCGDTFRKKPWLVRQNGEYRFCSRDCFESSGCFRGSNSPTWVGGPNTYRGKDWWRIRKEVVSDQSGDCADCGTHVGDSLPVHHIRPYREFDSDEEANRRENLIGLCQSCHMKRERRDP